MLKHRWTDRICCAVLVVTLLLTGMLSGIASAGKNTGRRMGYEDLIFDQTRVHEIEIIMDDWEGFLETCTNEAYALCTVIIDGETFKNASIRAKGNTSLSSVKSFGNNRYSFKIEFDHYSPGGNYHGLDKLSLNNVIQDYTYMKDYLAYTLMNEMDVAAPLCSYASISVNGKAWGFYLAVEAVEESFLQRNYSSSYGELYKPDSMSFGGGRGNGKDFDMNNFSEMLDAENVMPAFPEMPAAPFPGNMEPSPGAIPAEAFPPGENRQQATEQSQESSVSSRRDKQRSPSRNGPGGMGSSDVKLQYTDDNPESYSNIFSNAKTDLTQADRQRLIQALKLLGEGDTSAVDTDAVIRYLVVHNFLLNGDSYTGNMVHNYYLYEKDGVLSMIPWDYNLALGGFSMGANGEAGSAVNSPIDSPVSGADVSDRPMISWIFEDENHLQQYHALYSEFIEKVFTSGYFERLFEDTFALISPYIENDPTAFYGYDKFLQGAQVLKEFCMLRAESISGQLNGTIPSTTEAQQSDPSALVDASHISLSDMGGMDRDKDFPFDNRFSSQDMNLVSRGKGAPGFGEDFSSNQPPQFGGSFPDGNAQKNHTSAKAVSDIPSDAAVSGNHNIPALAVSAIILLLGIVMAACSKGRTS